MQVDDEQYPQAEEGAGKAPDADQPNAAPVDGAALAPAYVGVERNHQHEQHDRDQRGLEQRDDGGAEHGKAHAAGALGEGRDEHGHADSAAVIAALAYIKRVNDTAGTLRIHGANISLGYDFEPAWFAAGHTPVCKAVNDLAATGVLVVVAAGNTGTYQGGITDPGNAEHALTVGSAHSTTPTSHGVSFFSAVGPTRDGRVKPDLVAPGEQLVSATRTGYEPRSGTSVAAAYTSGVAAALAVASAPAALKPLLMRTATNLQRDRYYQGAGFINGTAAREK